MARKYVAVIHTWFVDSKGFDVVDLKADSLKSANQEAALISCDSDAFNKKAFQVIEISDGQIMPRRLTLRERLVGRID